jgi:ferredoxin
MMTPNLSFRKTGTVDLDEFREAVKSCPVKALALEE